MSGIFGCFDVDGNCDNVVRSAYYGIFSLQHRGQESAGIAVNNGGAFLCHKNDGLVADVFDDMTLSALQGTSAIAHCRGGSSGISGSDAIQPSVIKSRVGNIALTSDSVIMNDDALREELKGLGAIFQTNTDSEIILSLFSRNRIKTEDCEHAILETMKQIRGVYSMIFMTDNKLIGVRDPFGLRPLVLGRKGSFYFLSSETCALDAVDAEFVRDLEPGEVVSISRDKVTSFKLNGGAENKADGKVCLFEYVYVARPDSVIDKMSVFDSRYRAGLALAKEQPCDVDLVIGAPDSGNAAAEGFAQGLGVHYGAGLLKNRYVGRTFIKSTQTQRELAVKMKFAVLRTAIAGKRIAIVDDSLVRGTTTGHIISFLRANGAAEVHVRLASPPVRFGCCYGVNAAEEELPAATKSVDEIRDMIGADSLGYISLEALKESLSTIDCGVCSACFDGCFIAGRPDKSIDSVHKVTYS